MPPPRSKFRSKREIISKKHTTQLSKAHKGTPTVYGSTSWKYIPIAVKGKPLLGSSKQGRTVFTQGIGAPTQRRQGPVIT